MKMDRDQTETSKVTMKKIRLINVIFHVFPCSKCID
jgi:hypothetical protein